MGFFGFFYSNTIIYEVSINNDVNFENQERNVHYLVERKQDMTGQTRDLYCDRHAGNALVSIVD